VRVCVCKCIYIYMYIYVCVCMCIYIHMCVCVCEIYDICAIGGSIWILGLTRYPLRVNRGCGFSLPVCGSVKTFD